MSNIRNIAILGGRNVGKTALVDAMMQLINAADQAAIKMQTLSESLENRKPFVITNPYQNDLVVYDGNFKKNKPKKPYWHKGKLKYK